MDGIGIALDLAELSKREFADSGLYVVTGDNGSGKSTLLRGIYNGDIVLSGIAPHDTLLIPQDYATYLYPYKPIWWNIALPSIVKGDPQEELPSRTQGLLDEYEISKASTGYPLSASGGEQHAFVLLRVFFSDHYSTLLIDEPMTSLDEGLRHSFWSIIQELAHRKLIIVVSHTVPSSILLDLWVSIKGYHGKQFCFSKAKPYH